MPLRDEIGAAAHNKCASVWLPSGDKIPRFHLWCTHRRKKSLPHFEGFLLFWFKKWEMKTATRIRKREIIASIDKVLPQNCHLLLENVRIDFLSLVNENGNVFIWCLYRSFLHRFPSLEYSFFCLYQIWKAIGDGFACDMNGRPLECGKALDVANKQTNKW